MGGSGTGKAPEAEGEGGGVLSCLPCYSVGGLELKKGVAEVKV